MMVLIALACVAALALGAGTAFAVPSIRHQILGGPGGGPASASAAVSVEPTASDSPVPSPSEEATPSEEPAQTPSQEPLRAPSQAPATIAPNEPVAPISPENASWFLIHDYTIAASLPGYTDHPGQGSANWEKYFGAWTYTPASCGVLEEGATTAPAGWAMSYGTDSGNKHFVKQQAAVFDALAAGAEQCSSFAREQGNGRSYAMSASGLARDVVPDYESLSYVTTATGEPATWESSVVVILSGNAVIWVNGGTYGGGSNTVDTLALVETGSPIVLPDTY